MVSDVTALMLITEASHNLEQSINFVSFDLLKVGNCACKKDYEMVEEP